MSTPVRFGVRYGTLFVSVCFFRIRNVHVLDFVISVHLSRFVTKPTTWVSDEVRHKPGCAATKDS